MKKKILVVMFLLSLFGSQAMATEKQHSVTAGFYLGLPPLQTYSYNYKMNKDATVSVDYGTFKATVLSAEFEGTSFAGTYKMGGYKDGGYWGPGLSYTTITYEKSTTTKAKLTNIEPYFESGYSLLLFDLISLDFFGRVGYGISSVEVELGSKDDVTDVSGIRYGVGMACSVLLF